MDFGLYALFIYIGFNAVRCTPMQYLVMPLYTGHGFSGLKYDREIIRYAFEYRRK